jgi:hypothetical protein
VHAFAMIPNFYGQADGYPFKPPDPLSANSNLMPSGRRPVHTHHIVIEMLMPI